MMTHPKTTTHQRLTDDQRAELGITEGIGAFLGRICEDA